VTRRFLLSSPTLLLAARRAEELRRFPAAEAHQAVAVDADHFYAIGNHVIGKYDKRSGKRVAGWQCEKGQPLIHLNSGVVRDNVLYCAHSNYPAVPMTSSIEMWNTRTLRPSGSHSFGIFEGSATWVDFRDGRWYVTFGNYTDARLTSLVEFDTEWRRLRAWTYPDAVTAKLGKYTVSGGTFDSTGRLYCTGHDDPEMYVLRFPEDGSTLVLQETIAVANQGQGIALDPTEPGVLYAIDRSRREIIVMRLSA
jgi:hypothetical protein